jgi:predicted dinucleotide-binding enzyme
MKEKIGILGSGVVGQTLTGGFLRLGHEVKVGTRDTSKLKEWLEKQNNSKVSTGSFQDAASFGEIIVLATNGLGTTNAIDLAGKDNFKGKIVIDVTNALDASQGVPPKLASTLGNSLGEQIQRHIPDARVVKAFNIVNCYIMVYPMLEEGVPDMFTAGNDKDAKNRVSDLALAWGWNTCNDLGGIEQAYWLETFAMLWIVYGFVNNHWTHAFKLLRK